jgi:hypothetical protein
MLKVTAKVEGQNQFFSTTIRKVRDYTHFIMFSRIQESNRNQEVLAIDLDRIRSCLQGRAQDQRLKEFPTQAVPLIRLKLNWILIQYLLQTVIQAVSPVKTLVDLFGLSSFERDILLLCAGIELESTWAPLCAAAQGDPQRAYPTFSLALGLFPHAHWSAFTPDAPLRRWRLITIGSGNSLLTSPLRIQERILHFLLGLPYLDEPLRGIIEPVQKQGSLVPSHEQMVDQITGTWSFEETEWPVIQLCGEDAAGKIRVALAACERMGKTLYSLFAGMLPVNPQDLHQLMQVWIREAALSQGVLLVDCDASGSEMVGREGSLLHLIEHLHTPLMLVSRFRRPARQRSMVTFEINTPTSQEQRILWQRSLGQVAEQLNGHIDVLVSQFNLSTPTIEGTCARVLGQAQREDPDLKSILWQACRQQARPRLEDLAQRMDSTVSWEELVLPDHHIQTLKEVVAHVQQRSRVYEQWGFGNKSGRGLGISALFAGPSGTGKTLAAEVMANELKLDLYRIDLSTVVSKYIGETEKNLGRVFDAAETGGAVLLFDEADALFGKRSEVKDSNDRYANIEVGYLLQRMEAYRGLAILTTNLKDSIDTAFMRRIRFTIRFTFPDVQQRMEIWRRVFPKQTPTQGLSPAKLAQLNVAGGNIRNIALNAAFLAADAGEPVQMKYILAAARSEYAKLERTLTDVEIKGWV